MAEISPEKYSLIAQYYSEAADQVADVGHYYYDAAYEVLIIQQFDPEIALLSTFFSTYKAMTSSFDSPSAVITAVSALQRHILDKARTDADGRYTDINDWLEDNSLTVPEGFADLSALGGFPIEDGNVA